MKTIERVFFGVVLCTIFTMTTTISKVPEESPLQENYRAPAGMQVAQVATVERTQDTTVEEPRLVNTELEELDPVDPAGESSGTSDSPTDTDSSTSSTERTEAINEEGNGPAAIEKETDQVSSEAKSLIKTATITGTALSAGPIAAAAVVSALNTTDNQNIGPAKLDNNDTELDVKDSDGTNDPSNNTLVVDATSADTASTASLPTLKLDPAVPAAVAAIGAISAVNPVAGSATAATTAAVLTASTVANVATNMGLTRSKKITVTPTAENNESREVTVAEEEATVAEEEATVAEEEVTVAEEEATLAEEEATLAEEEATLAEEEVTVAEEEATVAEEEVTVAEEEATLAEEEVTVAEGPQTNTHASNEASENQSPQEQAHCKVNAQEDAQPITEEEENSKVKETFGKVLSLTKELEELKTQLASNKKNLLDEIKDYFKKDKKEDSELSRAELLAKLQASQQQLQQQRQVPQVAQLGSLMQLMMMGRMLPQMQQPANLGLAAGMAYDPIAAMTRAAPGLLGSQSQIPGYGIYNVGGTVVQNIYGAQQLPALLNGSSFNLTNPNTNSSFVLEQPFVKQAIRNQMLQGSRNPAQNLFSFN